MKRIIALLSTAVLLTGCFTPGPTIEPEPYYITYAIHYPDTMVVKTCQWIPPENYIVPGYTPTGFKPEVRVLKNGNSLIMINRDYKIQSSVVESMSPIEIISCKRK